MLCYGVDVSSSLEAACIQFTVDLVNEWSSTLWSPMIVIELLNYMALLHHMPAQTGQTE